MTSVAASGVRELVDRVHAGDVRALARAISLVENDAPEAADLLSGCFPHTGGALRVGVTGSPGAGKSTLVDKLTRAWRSAGTSVGVVAVDPSSAFTGGAILGDRIRMHEAIGDNGFYVRSMATRGCLGGMARATAEVSQIIEASGKDVVLIETVGVGQDEVDIARLADVTVVVLVPGMGDDVQSIKAGIMEIADIFVVNKADRDGADRVDKEIRVLQSIGGQSDPWTAPIVKTIATTGEGVDDLLREIENMKQWLDSDGRLQARRKVYWRERIEEMVRQGLLKQARTHGLSADELAEHAGRIAAREEDPYQLVPQLVARVFNAQGANG